MWVNLFTTKVYKTGLFESRNLPKITAKTVLGFLCLYTTHSTEKLRTVLRSFKTYTFQPAKNVQIQDMKRTGKISLHLITWLIWDSILTRKNFLLIRNTFLPVRIPSKAMGSNCSQWIEAYIIYSIPMQTFPFQTFTNSFNRYINLSNSLLSLAVW